MALSPFSIPQSTSTTTSLQIPPTLPIYLHAVTGNGDRRTVPHAAYCESCDLDCTLQRALNSSQPECCFFSQFTFFWRQLPVPTFLLSIHQHGLPLHLCLRISAQPSLVWQTQTEGDTCSPSVTRTCTSRRKQPAPTKALSSSATSSPPIISWARLFPSASQQLFTYSTFYENE